MLRERGAPARRDAVGRRAADGRDRPGAAEREQDAARSTSRRRASPRDRHARWRACSSGWARSRRCCSSSRTSPSSARLAGDAVVLDQGRVVYTGPPQPLLDDRAGPAVPRRLRGAAVSTFVLLTITGLGLGALYFLVASGLSLIYGLMGVLNFAHGALHHDRRVRGWRIEQQLGHRAGRGSASCSRPSAGSRSSPGLRRAGRARPDPAALPAAHRAGARDRRPGARARGADPGDLGLRRAAVLRPAAPAVETTTVGGATSRTTRCLEIGSAVAVLVGLLAFLRYTRYGLIVRAGVENRAMVTALGIDVRKAFTLVFAIGGLAAGIAGVLSGVYFGSVDPHAGDLAPDLRVHRRRSSAAWARSSARRSPQSSSACSSSTRTTTARSHLASRGWRHRRHAPAGGRAPAQARRPGRSHGEAGVSARAGARSFPGSPCSGC